MPPFDNNIGLEPIQALPLVSNVDPARITSTLQNASFYKNSILNEVPIGSSSESNYSNWFNRLGTANWMFTGILGEKNSYNGRNGSIVSSLDSGYDFVKDTASKIPGGQGFSTMLEINKLLSNATHKFLGTDAETVQDAILDSYFLAPMGIINGAFGKKSDTFTKNQEAFATVGSDYESTNSIADNALEKSGKKYGLFSSDARHSTNRYIKEAKRQQSIMSDIADDATDRFAIRNSMAGINGNRRALDLQGGYNQSAIRVGRHGLSLKTITTAKRVVNASKYQQGGKTKDPFDFYLSTLPAAQRDSSDFRVKDYWEFNGKPKDFKEAISKGMFIQQPDGWHANSVAKNPATGEIEFMKSSSHPKHHMEVDWYNSDDGAEFRSQYELQKTEPYWKYVKRKPQGEAVGKYQEGGILELSLSDIPEEYLEPMSTIEEVTLDSILPEFKEGGKVNVIPEGALHARLHHMENAENLTKKGIPVVAEKEGGELEQQAEIEREEIIFRLEVTKKLEELLKKYSDDEASQKDKDQVAIEAGKLLVEEILNNTIDNTNNLL